MKDINQIIITALLSLPILLLARQENEFEYEFIQQDSCYSFRGSFVVEADADSVLCLIYDYEQISQYSFGAETIELIQQGETWYDLSYTYRKFLILENKSIWRRTLKHGEQKVVFAMISSQNNLAVMPEMIASTGYYQVKKENDLCQVEYFQQCVFESGFFLSAYINMAEKEAVRFLHEFKKYIENKSD